MPEGQSNGIETREFAERGPCFSRLQAGENSVSINDLAAALSVPRKLLKSLPGLLLVLELLNAELLKQIRERKSLEKELLDVTDRERRNIGIDLHDELGQQLTGLLFMAKGLELKLKSRGAPELAEARKLHALLNQALTQTRAFAKHLAPMEVEDQPLPVALNVMARRARTVFKISCFFSKRGRMPQLEAGIVRQLFNIAREALTNAVKHGKAKRIWLGVRVVQRALLLEIKNNGRPFLPGAASAGGMGLRNMKYRAGLIGAAIDFKPGPGRTTLVVCTLPLRNWPRGSA
jgi:signal transduction histidine kinase